MDLQISGKAFTVTGGTDGLGLATVKSLVAEGANVLVAGRTEEKFLGRVDEFAIEERSGIPALNQA